MRVIYSCGGSGGHIFPAVAVAEEIRNRFPESEVLFIGAKGRMEMTKVPKAGFDIKGLWISGIQRSLTFKNLLFPIKLTVSLIQAYRIIRSWKPDVVAGFGGYASGAALWVASKMNLPTLIMEQNSYPGLTNRLLDGKIDIACIAYPESTKWLSKSKTIVTGNPIRKSLNSESPSDQAKSKLGFDAAIKLVLIVGGSQGAGSINRALKNSTQLIQSTPHVGYLWQCGAYYYDDYHQCETAQLDNVKISAFLEDMSLAYDAADMVVCRAGALTIAELMHKGKASILVPSPNVAEDHQSVNAMSLVNEDAAVLLKDADVDQLATQATALLEDLKEIEKLEKNISALSKKDAAGQIADQIELLMKR